MRRFSSGVSAALGGGTVVDFELARGLSRRRSIRSRFSRQSRKSIPRSDKSRFSSVTVREERPSSDLLSSVAVLERR